MDPVRYHKEQHGIRLNEIDEDALKVIYRLYNHGHSAYLVGGGVRDLLLKKTPKDFDIATDATPRQIKGLFRNGFIIGRRFKLVHIRFQNGKIIEVATFRKESSVSASNDKVPRAYPEVRSFLISSNTLTAAD